MSLINGSTRWVLFLSASNEPEDRHIFDLAFGLYCLTTAGINLSDIFIYVDGKNRAWINSIIANGSSTGVTIKESKDFFSDQAANKYENMVMFVTGHGSLSGIDSSLPITPYKMLHCLKSSPNLVKAVVYLGQCYAGTFNYIAAGKKPNAQGVYDPDVIFMGATNLHDSVSSSTTEQFAGGPLAWVANLFLLHVFKWICVPVDVDGDGKFTIMDAYKYAGASSNGLNKNIKARSFVNSIGHHSRWVAAQNAHAAAPTPQNQLALSAIQVQYELELGVLYTHQECWILNSIPAQQIEI